MQVLTQSIPDDVHTWPRSNSVNRRIVLNSRPIGTPSAANFRFEQRAVPTPSAGQVLMRTLYVDGLENAPQAFISLLEGKRFGNLVIRVANDKPARTHGRQE